MNGQVRGARAGNFQAFVDYQFAIGHDDDAADSKGNRVACLSRCDRFPQ
jgi:hypothetical protein